jgi:hypothetical protein
MEVYEARSFQHERGVVEPGKCKALGSIRSTTQKKKGIKENTM